MEPTYGEVLGGVSQINVSGEVFTRNALWQACFPEEKPSPKYYRELAGKVDP